MVILYIDPDPNRKTYWFDIITITALLQLPRWKENMMMPIDGQFDVDVIAATLPYMAMG